MFRLKTAKNRLGEKKNMKTNLRFIPLDDSHPDSASLPKTKSHLLAITDNLKHVGLDSLATILRAMPKDQKYAALDDFSPEIRKHMQQTSCVRLVAFEHTNPDQLFALTLFANSQNYATDFQFREDNEIGYCAFAVMITETE